LRFSQIVKCQKGTSTPPVCHRFVIGLSFGSPFGLLLGLLLGLSPVCLMHVLNEHILLPVSTFDLHLVCRRFVAWFATWFVTWFAWLSWAALEKTLQLSRMSLWREIGLIHVPRQRAA